MFRRRDIPTRGAHDLTAIGVVYALGHRATEGERPRERLCAPAVGIPADEVGESGSWRESNAARMPEMAGSRGRPRESGTTAEGDVFDKL
jgi:hypothetical protein